MSNSMIEDIKEKIYNCGTQKILDTMNVGAKGVGELKREAEEIAQKIWLDTLRECSKPITHVELEGLFEQKISDWCKNNK